MWGYIICAIIWVALTPGWLVPVARKRIVHEIYEVCGLGGFFSLLALNISGSWSSYDILALEVAGFVLYAPGMLFVILAVINLRFRGRPKDAWEQTTVIVRSGVYGIVRHPLYFGTAIWTVGVMLIFPSVPSAILGVACIVSFYMASCREDAYNVEKFGPAYKEYMEEVPLCNVFKSLLKT